MIINDEIHIKHEIKRESKLYLISDDIRRDIENYNKKEDDRRKQYKN